MLSLRKVQYSSLKNFYIYILEVITGFTQLSKVHDDSIQLMSPEQNFWQACVQVLKLKVQLKEGDLTRIPKTGPILIVANHPFGGVEAIVLAQQISEVRKDFMFIANNTLNKIPEVAPYLFSVDIDEAKGISTRIQNRTQVQNAIQHLKANGALILFPAGEVSTAFPPWKKAYDKKWSSTVAKIAKESQANVLTIHFSGKNSFLFQFLSIFLFDRPTNFLSRYLRKLSLTLRGTLMVYEIISKKNSVIKMRIGTPITYNQIKHIESNKALAEYFRLRTYLLGGDPQLVKSRLDFIKKRITRTNSAHPRKLETIASPVEQKLLLGDIAVLNQNPEKNIIHQNKDMFVYLAKADKIPHILQEIGRLREVTFRAEGEGSGLAIDLDPYDQDYEHLFIWHKLENKLIGAYRLGMVSELINKGGIEKVYTQSLFKYDINFINEIGESMELGRSFVIPEYQRSPALNLLLTSIAKLLLNRPHIKTLFGPASISAEYSKISSFVMIEFLMRQHGAEDKVQSLVKPSLPYKLRTDLDESNLSALIRGAENLEGLNAMVEAVEGEKAVPTLITYYSKMGAKYVAFSVDRDFNSIDGLIIVKLLDFPKPMLKRMLGKDVDKFYSDRMI
ncbi:MAG: lysophospholipid acyltransferase family protein [Bdellovibrionaceae bacterium]|nr:lysophospholipid acyltransferase family protein [Pseudobdellovibrionaceae bacterium]